MHFTKINLVFKIDTTYSPLNVIEAVWTSMDRFGTDYIIGVIAFKIAGVHVTVGGTGFNLVVRTDDAHKRVVVRVVIWIDVGI